MSATIRLFFAASVSDGARASLQDAALRIREAVPFARWTHPADYHATVKFLGDVPPELEGRLDAPVREAVRGMGAFELTLGEMGAFGRKTSPDILWCGVGGASDSLRELHRRVDEASASCGIEPDDRPFRPHLTVARKFRGPAPFPDYADRLRELAPEPVAWRVEELLLYRTNFGQRPAYEVLNRFPLQ
ncbi:RNA 2',3'-cyclic phosphodiesterase [Paenibacillus sp. TRM 82003]|nr:RNA 2',3'-cyclic phosphodiesterase [Paenibacillus sp. TRM 82003]